MYCTKCGKEISDGENKVCDECQKKVLDDIMTSENEEPIKDESKTKKSKEEFKVAKDDKKKFSKKGIIAIVAVIIAIAILGYLQYFTGFLSKLFMTNNTVGNTVGNIRNYGYATTQKDWIYYLAPDETGSKVGIFKIKTNGKDKQELLMEEWDIISLNVVGDYLYFIVIDSEAVATDTTLSDSDEISLDYVNNKIYKMKIDGTELTILNDNEFNDDCYEIYIVKDAIYYIGTDSNIYKMDLDGNNRSLVSNNKTGYLGITEDYILYNNYPEGTTEESTDYVTYIMNIDGTDERAVLEGERLYSVNIKDGYIYYTNSDKQICRIKIGGTEEELLYDITAYNMNLSGNYIYYLNYADIENSDYTVCVYKVKADGTDEQPTMIKALETYSSFIDIVGDWVIYMDSNDESGFINLVKVDGSDEIQLYLINYADMYDETTDIIEDETATTEENTTEVTAE